MYNPGDPDEPYCEYCGGDVGACDCEERAIAEYEAEEEMNRCTCQYCFCMNTTEGGGKCGDCYRGIHQG